MSDTQYESYASWRTIEDVWRQTQESWRDSRADHFAEHFWQQFEDDMTAYLRTLDELIDTLSTAREVAWEP